MPTRRARLLRYFASLHGPTVQIARSPTSIALSSGSPTAALTFTAKDANGVATGARVYAVSSDQTVTTVDKDTWLATRVASGSAVLYGQLTDPTPSALAEPVYTGTGGQTSIYSSTLSEYAGMTSADMLAATGGADIYSGATRFVPNRTDSFTSVIAAAGGLGTGLRMHGQHNMPADTYTYGNFDLALGSTADPAGNLMATHYLTHLVKYDTTEALPLSTPYRFKGWEGWHVNNGTRVQFATTDATPVPGKLTAFQSYESSNEHSPQSSSAQFVGPWFNTDMANSGTAWRHTYEIKPNSVSPGTVDIFLQQGDYYFVDDIAVTAGVANGDRIMIPNSTAEFLVSALTATVSWGGANRTHATITRQSNLVGNKGTFAIHIQGHANVTQTAVFSLSQAGILTTGTNGGYVTIYATPFYYRVASFDGTFGCTLVREVPDATDSQSPLYRDLLSQSFNNTQDGYCRMWIAPASAAAGTGTLVLDNSLTGVANGVAAKSDICTLVVNDGIQHWKLFGAQTEGGDMDYTVYGPIKWWYTA